MSESTVATWKSFLVFPLARFSRCGQCLFESFEGPSVRLSRIMWADSNFEGYPTSTGSWYTLPVEAELQFVNAESSDC